MHSNVHNNVLPPWIKEGHTDGIESVKEKSLLWRLSYGRFSLPELLYGNVDKYDSIRSGNSTIDEWKRSINTNSIRLLPRFVYDCHSNVHYSHRKKNKDSHPSYCWNNILLILFRFLQWRFYLVQETQPNEVVVS